MLWQAISAARDLGRLYDIASVLVRHGFGDVVRRLGLADFLERLGRRLHWAHADDIARLSAPERVRRALEEMGPTFVKLGQVLSTRVDLFGPEWIAEFEKLQDRAAPVPFEALRAQLAEDLGGEPEALFAEFERVALAAGSIAQVHRAVLADGTAAVVKIRRPGIRDTVDADMRLLKRLAAVLQEDSELFSRFQPVQLMKQLERSLGKELDLKSEGRNAERIAADLAAHRHVVVPRIFWEWTNERVNVQEYVGGIPGRDMEALDAAGQDRQLIARRGAAAVLEMVLVHGFFHADPHPGNVFYLPDSSIALIDFGMVGRLTDERRTQLGELLVAFARWDTALACDLLQQWAGEGGGDAVGDTAALARDIDAFIDEFHGVPLEQIDVGALVRHIASIMRDHGLVMPPDLALLLKAAISLEGLGRMLDPAFDMVSEARPLLERMARERRSPRAVARRGLDGLRQMLELAEGVPVQLKRLMRASRRGAIPVQVEIVHLDEAAERVDRAMSRLTVGIVTAALIIGSSIVMNVDGERVWLGLPFFGLLGFLGAVAGGVWLFASMRS
jgi:ubiquinone biosynthesis protein